MKNYMGHDYAANKDSEAIVYRFVDGSITEITIEKFLASDPLLTEDDFRFWKTFSDQDYLMQDREEYRQTWKNVTMENILETMATTDTSPEVVIIEIPNETIRKLERIAVSKKIWAKLTYNQRRRYQMYYAQKMTEEQIAKIDGVSHQAVSKNLIGTDRKIRKLRKTFEKQVAET